MKHSPKKLEFFGETCISLEIFSENRRRRSETVQATFHPTKMAFALPRMSWEPYDLQRLQSIGIRSRIHWGVQVGIFFI